MVEAGKGSIVTIASIAAKHPDAGPIPYVCSKSAVDAYQKAFEAVGDIRGQSERDWLRAISILI